MVAARMLTRMALGGWATLAVLAGCSGGKVTGGATPCTTAADCEAGRICDAGECTNHCTVPADCAPIEMTCRDGVCAPPICGNGRVEIGEICDGDCPADCDDADPCTRDTMAGSAAGCDAECSHATIAECLDGDGCCPAACSAADDDDCPADFVLALEAESGEARGEMAVQAGVLADPACGDSWVEVPLGAGVDDFVWSAAAPALPAHRVELAVDLPHAGTYYLWLRLASPGGEHDAMYAGFEASDLRRVYPSSSYGYDRAWTWLSTVEEDERRLVFDELPAGRHTLVLGHAEAGVQLDKVVLADTPDARFELSCGDPVDQVCGDGRVTGDEVCDILGPVLAGETCQSQGFAGGALGCRADCAAFDTGDCVEELSFGLEGFGTDSRFAYAGTTTPEVLIVDSLAPGVESTPGTNRGTFRWAISREYPRIILFEVGGVIDYSGVDDRIEIEAGNSYLSIFGQTAPPPGITIKGAPLLIIDVSDVLLQHLKLRLGDDPANSFDPDGGDALIVRRSQRVVVDHCSLSWAIDEVASAARGSNDDITFSRCIIAEALCKSQHYKEGELYPEKHSYNLLTYHGDMTFKDNLFAFSYGRNPVLRPGRKDVINNFVYATGWAGPMLEWYADPNLPAEPMLASVVGNVVLPLEDEFDLGSSDYAVYVVNQHSDDSRLYVADNQCRASRDDPSLTQWQRVTRSDLITQAASPATDLSRYTIRPSREVEDHVLATAGAFYWDRDATDARVVAQVASRSGGLVDSVYALPARASALTAPGFVSGAPDGRLDGGFDWSAAPSSFEVDGTTVALTADCGTIEEVVAHIDDQLPAGVRCVQLNGAIDLPYVGLETVALGAAVELTVSGAGLQQLGITPGTYRGADALEGYTAEQTAHTLEAPDHPHQMVQGLSRLERWVIRDFGP